MEGGGRGGGGTDRRNILEMKRSLLTGFLALADGCSVHIWRA